MASYFDKAHADLRQCEEDLRDAFATDNGMAIAAAVKRMEDIEAKVLFDVQLCASLPHFPADLADGVQIVIAACSLEPLYNVCRDLPDESEQFRYLNRLVSELHTVFHQVGYRNIEGLSDKPDSILRCQAESRYERRVELMRDSAHQEKFPDFAEQIARYDRQNALIQAELDAP